MSETQFRSNVRAWLSERFSPRDPQHDDDRVDIITRTRDGHRALIDRAVGLQGDLHSAGFVGCRLPIEYGGQGLTRRHDEIVAEELSLVEAPTMRPLTIGMSLVLPTLMGAGSHEQCLKFLPRLVSGQAIWCQLFSEPDAGSDLVALRTTAVRDGESWVVSGQKVWSSLASDASYGILLARTDPHAAKPHTGITMFIIAMDLPGVTVRPLVDIAGGHHFNEVFLDEVVLGDSDVIGEVNRGWQIANGTLSGERSGYLGGSGNGRRRRQTEAALDRSALRHNLVARQRVADVVARELILEWLAARIEAGGINTATAQATNPAVGSLVKVAAGNLEQRSAELVIDLLGAQGIAWAGSDRDGDIAAHSLNASRQATIAGGTHQIQRNLIGERLLDLPREPR